MKEEESDHDGPDASKQENNIEQHRIKNVCQAVSRQKAGQLGGF